MADAIVAHLYGLDEDQFRWVLRNCDVPSDQLSDLAFRARLPAKGFWRTGIGATEHAWRQAWSCEPELRLTNLALVAFVELDRLKNSLKGDLAAAVAAFAPIKGSGGWRLPERLRLRDYGLGHDLRAEEAQELRSRLRRESPTTESVSQTSWSDCRLVAEKLRGLWPGSDREPPASPEVGTRRGRRVGRDSATGQAKLFGGDE